MKENFTLGEVAKITGVSKPTLSRWHKDGRLQGTRKENGSYTFTKYEIFKCFPDLTGKDLEEAQQKTGTKRGRKVGQKSIKQEQNEPVTQSVTPSAEAQLAKLEAELSTLKDFNAFLLQANERLEQKNEFLQNRLIPNLSKEDLPQIQHTGFLSSFFKKII